MPNIFASTEDGTINKEAYAALVGRGNVEANILDGIEIEFEKYNAQKKKK